jgi:CHAD domain-containing protein
MAFQFRPGEAIGRGLRRLAKKELRSARRDLRGSSTGNDAIHEARKRIKKVRAIAALLDADEGSGLQGCRKRLRRTNRRLSQLRDADAMLETLKMVRSRHPDLLREHAFARLQRRLTSQKEKALNAAHGGRVWKKIDRDLRSLRRRAKGWRPTHRGFAALAAGLRSTHRQGRKAKVRAFDRQRAIDFHEWRKSMKALWYELRLLEGCDAGIRNDVRALHDAETLLGDDHNLVLLCAEVSKDPSLCDREELQRVVERDQADLRERAAARMARIYNQKPRAYVLRIKQAWRNWRRRAGGHKSGGSRSAAA